MKSREELLKLSENILIIDRAFRNEEFNEVYDISIENTGYTNYTKGIDCLYSTQVTAIWNSFYVYNDDPDWDCLTFSPTASTIDTLSSGERITLELNNFDLSEEMLFQYSTTYNANELEAIFVKVYLNKYRNDESKFYLDMTYYPELCERLGL